MPAEIQRRFTRSAKTRSEMCSINRRMPKPTNEQLQPFRRLYRSRKRIQVSMQRWLF
uniref:Uncharacterized protein n=1 Tax=Romanomermis culicivorax TaxID=13658 RepID=A0A915JTQ4_ROMCU